MVRIPVYVYQHNHFDPLWQRCWDRVYDHRGRRIRSYAELQERVIDLWLENARRGAVVVEGQAAVLRKYLERNPGRLLEIRRLVKDGRIELLACGELVCDTNMPSGETLLRSFVLGQRYFEDTFGVLPAIASLEDAFGHSAQLPQILRGVGCTAVTYLSRKRVPGEHWRGLDGSVVCTLQHPSTRHVGHWRKVPPCPQCRGVGCDACGGRGLADAAGFPDEDIWRELTTDWGEASFGALGIGGEEATPNPRLPDMVDRARTELGMDVRWGILELLASRLAGPIARLDDPLLQTSPQVEANCVYTGCYVSRIRTKQDLRRIESLLNTAERWATVAYLLGAPYPERELCAAWRHTVFLAFHDAVTGTHLDQPYLELVSMQEAAERASAAVLEASLSRVEERIPTAVGRRYLVVHNADSWERSDPVLVRVSGCGVPELTSPSGHRVRVLDASAAGSEVLLAFRTPVPALGSVALEIGSAWSPLDEGEVREGAGEVENEHFLVRAGERGIESILDKRSGQALSHPGYLVNELLLEEDRGDPWGTSVAPPPPERLGAYTARVAIRRATNASEVFWQGQYRGGDDGISMLCWQQSMMLYRGYDRIDFRTEIHWDGRNRRIRVALPTGLHAESAFYSIPYGAIERRGYEPEMDPLIGTNGDWPALYWVDVHDEEADWGVAVLNTGTPSHKIQDGVVLLSLLRCPADLWSATEEDFDHCVDLDGARDAGAHGFTYSVIPHRGDYRSAGIERRGRELNNPLICRPVAGSGTGGPGFPPLRVETTDGVLLTALKKADGEDAVVVRLAETAGRHGSASLHLGRSGAQVTLVDFLERNPRPAPDPLLLTPFGIATVRLAGSGRAAEP